MNQQPLLTMLQLQDNLNRQIDSNWLDAGFAWYRAIWLESAELMEHYGWKWWKAQQHDIEQIRLELIDIWHFGLSAELVCCKGDYTLAAQNLQQEMETTESADNDFRTNVDRLALHALTHKRLDMIAFMALLQAAGSSFDDLYRIYVGKNVLNRFRQDHGYQDGSYLKTWAGREDNEHLAELANALDAGSKDFQQQLYDGLAARYAELSEPRRED